MRDRTGRKPLAAGEALCAPTSPNMAVEFDDLVELGFDGESQGQRADFRPMLPLLFHW